MLQDLIRLVVVILAWTGIESGAGFGADVAVRSQKENLDKSGTRAWRDHECDSQPVSSKQVANRGSLGAERTGFEPVVEFNPHTGLANRRFRPLSHLSKTCNESGPHFKSNRSSGAEEQQEDSAPVRPGPPNRHLRHVNGLNAIRHLPWLSTSSCR